MDAQLSKKLKDCGIKKARIEQLLDLPKNSLSGMINGTRNTPKKTEERLWQFINDHENPPAGTPEAMFKQMQNIITRTPVFGGDQPVYTIDDLGRTVRPEKPHGAYLIIPEKQPTDTEGKPIPMADPPKWYSAEWIKKVEDYCGLAGITPEELIEQHAMKGAKKEMIPATKAIVEDAKKEKEEKPEPPKGYSRRFNKLGF